MDSFTLFSNFSPMQIMTLSFVMIVMVAHEFLRPLKIEISTFNTSNCALIPCFGEVISPNRQ